MSDDEAQPRKPQEDEYQAIVENIGVPVLRRRPVAQALARHCLQIVSDINAGRHKLHELAKEERAAVEAMLAALTEVQKKLRAFQFPNVRRHLARRIGRDLSSRRFDSVGGLAVDVSHRDLEIVKTRPALDMYALLEDAASFERETIFMAHGEKVIRTMMLDWTIALGGMIPNDPPRGGRVGREQRRFILLQLIPFHAELAHDLDVEWGVEKYRQLADQVMQALGQDTKGLEQAIDRLLNQLRMTSP